MLKTTDIYVVHEKLSLLYVAVWVWVGWGVLSLCWLTRTEGDTLSLQDPVVSLILSDLQSWESGC